MHLAVSPGKSVKRMVEDAGGLEASPAKQSSQTTHSPVADFKLLIRHSQTPICHCPFMSLISEQ